MDTLRKRLITIQGPTQFMNVVSTLYYEKRELGISAKDTLCVYGLYKSDLARICLEFAKVWDWEKVVVFAEDSYHTEEEIKGYLGDNFDEIYLCRNYLHHYDYRIPLTYFSAKNITYGDGFGIVDFIEEVSSRPFDAVKVVIGIEYTARAIRRLPYQVTPILYLHELVSKIQSLPYIADLLTNFSNKMSLQTKNIYLITLANLTESQHALHLEDELSFYYSAIERLMPKRFKDALLVIKAHPRETLHQSKLLTEKLAAEGYECMNMTHDIDMLPVEIICSYMPELHIIPLFSSSFIQARLISNTNYLIDQDIFDFDKLNPLYHETVKLYLKRIEEFLAKLYIENDIVAIYENNGASTEIEVNSPLYPAEKSKCVQLIDTDYISHRYTSSFNLDVSRLVFRYKHVGIYECPISTYRFYYPFDIEGDSKFYEHLQQYDWYYMPWKWEHQQASTQLASGMKVLEVGCAKGSFLKRIAEERQVTVTGLELNERAAATARQELGLDVRTETIQAHAIENSETYDAVCSFQVLEHIADVHSFLEAKVKCLKKGGKLIIGVPNNASFLGLNDNLLNMPPHHMGLWDRKSLTRLTEIFSISLDKIYLEPLQVYHKEYFQQIFNNLMEDYKKYAKIKFGILGSFVFSMFKTYFKHRVYKRYPEIENYTLVAVYTKK